MRQHISDTEPPVQVSLLEDSQADLCDQEGAGAELCQEQHHHEEGEGGEEEGEGVQGVQGVQGNGNVRILYMK